VAIVGPNGAGKSTVLKSCHGLLPAWTGDVLFDGSQCTSVSVAERVRRGMAMCPQGGRVFTDCTVWENLLIGGHGLRPAEAKRRLASVIALFPTLESRLGQAAGTMSGGEQQLVAIARALIGRPQLLMLDEPTLGLGSKLATDVLHAVMNVNRTCGVALLIVEHRVMDVLRMAQRAYVLKLGRVAYEGAASELGADRALLERLFVQ